LRPLPRSPLPRFRLPRRAVVAVLAIVGGYAAARALQLKLPVDGPEAVDATTVASADPSQLAAVDADGNALLLRSLNNLERWPNVRARYRQAVRVGEELQSGVGGYWQTGVGNTRCTCWQWQTVVDGQQAVFAQVYDRGGYLWTDTRFPERRSVTRVNVGNLRRDLAAAFNRAGQGGAGGPTAAELELLARGGLSQLVAELRRSFEFGPPVAATLDGRTVAAIVGQWRSEPLAEQWQGLNPDSADGWPSHLPHHVVVMVGVEDSFPYRVEYRRGSDASLVGSVTPAGDPLARFEFFEVQWGVSMDPRLFEFTATDVDWRDVTGAVLERLRPAAPVAEAPPLARRDGAWRQ
jgi:hypothetical protein